MKVEINGMVLEGTVEEFVELHEKTTQGTTVENVKVISRNARVVDERTFGSPFGQPTILGQDYELLIELKNGRTIKLEYYFTTEDLEKIWKNNETVTSHVKKLFK
jgi:hypothetical protein